MSSTYHRTEDSRTLCVTFLAWRVFRHPWLHKFQFHIHVSCSPWTDLKGNHPSNSQGSRGVTGVCFLDILMCLLFCWESSCLRVLAFCVIIQKKALPPAHKGWLKLETYYREKHSPPRKPSYLSPVITGDSSLFAFWAPGISLMKEVMKSSTKERNRKC